MSYEIFGAEFAEAFAKEINSSEVYRDEARTWKDAMVFVLLADPELGLDADLGVFLDLNGGQCREARIATEADRARTKFVITGTARVWKDIYDGKLDPVAAFRREQVTVERGSRGILTAYLDASRELLEALRRIDLELPAGVEEKLNAAH